MKPRHTFAVLLCLLTMAASADPARVPSPSQRAAAAAYSAADRAFERGDLALARDLTRELTAQFPDDPAPWLRLAIVEQRLGRFEESLRAYDEALDVEAAYSIDGGRTLAKVRFQRATLLLAEAERDLAASGDLPLGESLDAARTALRRDLYAFDPLLESPTRETKPRADRQPAHGYVVETPPAAKPAPAREEDR